MAMLVAGATNCWAAAAEMMKKVTLDEIMGLERYEQARDERRRPLPAHDLTDDLRHLVGRQVALVDDARDGLLQPEGRRGLAHAAPRVRLVEVGQMAGPVIALPADVLRSSGLEVLGSGPGTIPLTDIVGAIPQVMAIAATGDLPIGINLTRVASQPTVVQNAIRGFTTSLAQAVIIVLGVSFLALGVRAGLAARKLLTSAGLFTRLAQATAASRHPPYDFAVVDEAQDFSIAHLRFFAALGGTRPNALFFAGDLGQRIFQLPFSWKVRRGFRQIYRSKGERLRLRHHFKADLALDFTPADKDRMRGLSAKAREGTLSPAEQAEINSYERVGHLLNILQSKARRSLQPRRRTNGKTKGH